MKKYNISNLKDLENFQMTSFNTEEYSVCITKITDRFFAFNNICTHMGAPLHKGKITNEYVQCPWHGCKFNYKNGNCLNNNMKLETYEIVEENKNLFLIIDGNSS